jgi:hypothetical protein
MSKTAAFLKTLTLAAGCMTLMACGSAPDAASVNASALQFQDAQCLVIDSCTHASVDGYECRRRKYINDGSADAPDASYFQGKACAIALEDWQNDPACDPAHPTDTCGGGWGPDTHPCCPKVQGPGPKSEA